jgi:hypothetical protein
MTTTGNGYTLGPEHMTIDCGNIVIETSGYDFFTVQGDVWELPSDVSSADDLAVAFTLLGNHPNPFNPATVIAFTSASGGPGRLAVYDLAGRHQWETSFTAPPGHHQITWQARDLAGQMLPAGVYFYQVIMPEGRDSGRMVLVK